MGHGQRLYRRQHWASDRGDTYHGHTFLYHGHILYDYHGHRLRYHDKYASDKHVNDKEYFDKYVDDLYDYVFIIDILINIPIKILHQSHAYH